MPINSNPYNESDFAAWRAQIANLDEAATLAEKGIQAGLKFEGQLATIRAQREQLLNLLRTFSPTGI